ncbi:MAG: hypothetical protein WBG37_21210 [Desulfobacterales bacterium]
MIRKIIPALVIWTLVIWIGLTLPAAAQVEMEGFVWLLEPEGEAALGIEGLIGTVVDLKEDFGYSDTESAPGARVILGDTHQLVFSGFQFDASAESTVDRQIRFGDNLFAINERVSSAFDLTVLQAYYRLNLGPDAFHGGVLAGGEYIGVEAEASSPRLGSASVDADAGMFLIGAFAESELLPFLKLRASGMGGAFEISDVEADYFDFEIAILAQLPPVFQIGAGYRYIDVSAEDDSHPLTVDLTFKGPTLFIGFAW